MILEATWSCILLSLAAWFYWKTGHEDPADADNESIGLAPFYGISAVMLAMYLTWPAWGARASTWVWDSLPQQGTSIHAVTHLLVMGMLVVSTLVGFCGLFYWFGSRCARSPATTDPGTV